MVESGNRTIVPPQLRPASGFVLARCGPFSDKETEHPLWSKCVSPSHRALSGNKYHLLRSVVGTSYSSRCSPTASIPPVCRAKPDKGVATKIANRAQSTEPLKARQSYMPIAPALTDDPTVHRLAPCGLRVETP
jgi:hypothetical protein